jgi:hypothetical protein
VFERMAKWASENDIRMHDSLQFQQYDVNDWGLLLKEPVSRGTTLLQVPRQLVLDADCLQTDLDQANKLVKAVEQLGDFAIHKDMFLIFLKLLQCSCDKEGDASKKWAPWIQALPQTFPTLEFSKEEKECLPFYARYAADYQEKKFQAFCQGAKEFFGDDDDASLDEDTLKRAFCSVSSRCWKTVPLDDSTAPNTELVPVGDMFNTRDPPNVAILHDSDSDNVSFVYLGDEDENNKNLYITYGQPSNPHRFLAIFGFVDTSMPYAWSHLTYPDNPFCDDVSQMVVRASDGMVPKQVWDAVLYALLQPPKGTPAPVYTKEQHDKYYKFTSNVLKNHIDTTLQECKELRQKMDAISTTSDDGNNNLDLVRQHNEFLMTVFTRVQAYLENGGKCPDE